MDDDFAQDLYSFEFSQELYNLILQMVAYTLILPDLPRIIELNIMDFPYQRNENLILYLLELASESSYSEIGKVTTTTKANLFCKIFDDEGLYMVYKPFMTGFQTPMVWGDDGMNEKFIKEDLIFRTIMDRKEPISNRDEIDMIISYFYSNDIPLYIRSSKLRELQDIRLASISREEFIVLINDLFNIQFPLNFNQDSYSEEIPFWLRPKKTPHKKIPKQNIIQTFNKN